MKKKLFTFTYALAFIAENEPDAEKQLQKELNAWDESILDAGNWDVVEEEVEVSGELP
jgi:hypothetical protein